MTAVADKAAGGGVAWRNPLRDKRDKRMPRIPGPCGVVIFGVTGDLARKKLMPAIYDLANRGLLPPGFVVLGFARRDWGDGDFESLSRKAAQAEVKVRARERAAAEDRVRPTGGLETLEEVHRLLRRLPSREREVVRMFYLEGRSYEEISTALHLPVNTIGPVLSRARKKLQAAASPARANGKKRA